MITNIFSIFDPTNFFFPILTFWYFLIIPFNPFISSNTKIFIWIEKIFFFIRAEIKNLRKSYYSTFFLVPVFFIVLIINVISLIPSTYCLTAQCSIVIPFTFIFWLIIFFYAIFSKTNNFLCHLVPQGSPVALIPVMVLIESIRILIRPITISVRLIANITAGHLLIHLLSSFSIYIRKINFLFIFLIIIFSFILIILEIGVAFIQRYILCTLLTLYSSEN